MFQNINESTIDIENKTSTKDQKEHKKWAIFAHVFDKQNIHLYVLSFMTSMVGISGGIAPFGISMMAASLGNSIPILGVVLAGLIGSSIRFGIEGALAYLLTSFVLVVSVFLIKPRINEEEKNEKIKLAKHVFVASLIVQMAKIGITGFTLYDVLSGISFAMIAVVFYKIFVNSVVVLQDFREKKAFSIEEVLGASLLLAIGISCFGELSVLGFSIRNILSILIVLILGWKNGILVGTTAGVTIGVTLGVITASDPMTVAAFAISGMIAGILNRFGKLGVIIGFCLGNVVLAYVSNGYTVELIHFKEILIASIGLLAVPKSVQINIEEFMGSTHFLPAFPSGTLTRSKETATQLNQVSETIEQMANSYENKELDTTPQDQKEHNKQIFISELLDNLRGYEQNMLYDEMVSVDGPIIDHIFTTLMDKQEITREDLLSIFAEQNSYIVGFDDKQISSFLEENITQMVRVINMSYKISKSSFVWMKKMEENRKNMKSQLSGVSKVISDLAQTLEKDLEKEEEYTKEKRQILELLKQKGIEVQEVSVTREEAQGRFFVELYLPEDKLLDKQAVEKIITDVLEEPIVYDEETSKGNRYQFLSDDKYVMALGTAEKTKQKSDVSGDSMLSIRLKDGKYLVAISDGMGSGNEAKQSSSQALKMLENLLLSGFEKDTSLELINTSLINQNDEVFSTLDIAIVDLYKGSVEFIKSGACPTYIKNRKKVQIIKANSLPAGMIPQTNMKVMDRDIESGEIILMCSDGILDSNVEYKNKELWVRYLLEDIESTNTKKIADLVLQEAIDNNFGVAKDDMTVMAFKFLAK